MRAWVVIAMCAGCDSTHARPSDAPSDQPPAIDAPPPPCDVTARFGQAVAVPGVNTPGEDNAAWMTSDRLTIYFTHASGDYTTRGIYIATRPDPVSAFGAASLVAGVNTSGVDERPVLTADELTMFWDAVPSGTNNHIYSASRANRSDSFGSPIKVPELDSITDFDLAPWIDKDGLLIYFSSTRADHTANFEIYRSQRASRDQAFSPPVVVAELSSPASDSSPVASADGLEIFFASNRNVANSQNEIWHATRGATTVAFDPPTLVDELDDAAANDGPTWLSEDRCTLMFVSNRSGSYDLWIARRP